MACTRDAVHWVDRTSERHPSPASLLGVQVADLLEDAILLKSTEAELIARIQAAVGRPPVRATVGRPCCVGPDIDSDVKGLRDLVQYVTKVCDSAWVYDVALLLQP